MISHDQILSEMDRQLQIARRTGDERAVREALAAIRSLCEVVLGGEIKREEIKQAPSVAAAPFEGKILEEEDANGGSIFDF